MDFSKYLHKAKLWLDEHAERRPSKGELRWGEGSDRLAIFHDLSLEEEKAHIDEIRAWQRLKFDAGSGAISWPREYGGEGLPREFERAFQRLEREYVTPRGHEAVGISMNIEAPTVRALGSEARKERYVRSLLRCDELCCQLFSEPGAGSDLGAISTRAERVLGLPKGPR